MTSMPANLPTHTRRPASNQSLTPPALRLALFMTALLAGGAAFAQGGVCAFTKPGPGGPLLQATGKAYQDIEVALRALQVRANIAIFQSGSVGNAAAQPTGPNTGQIVYNPAFMGNMQRVNPWAPVSVLAHELGHIVGPTTWSSNSWSRELGADFVSGCALKRMGVSFGDATSALRAMFNSFGSPTHPDTPRRLEAMRTGYAQC